MTPRLPRWLIPAARKRPQLESLGKRLALLGVNTVCQSARCPNLGECFGHGIATFMILGNICTRDCRFCAVEHGVPSPVDPEEPRRVAEAARRLGLSHIVVTSVTRDDLPDGGADHFAATIGRLREVVPAATVEVLTPDFQGNRKALAAVLEEKPDVFNHNVETVPRLHPAVRPQADYRRSLEVLAAAREMDGEVITKSGLMVGLGEAEEEVLSVLKDLRQAGVEAITIGQYLQPTRKHHPVAEYISPAVFVRYGESARALGFSRVSSAPLVRSSYQAEEMLGTQ